MLTRPIRLWTNGVRWGRGYMFVHPMADGGRVRKAVPFGVASSAEIMHECFTTSSDLL